MLTYCCLCVSIQAYNSRKNGTERFGTQNIISSTILKAEIKSKGKSVGLVNRQPHELMT